MLTITSLLDEKRCYEEIRKRFDDLTNTVFSGHHQPLTVWVLCLYLMGLNLSNTQIAQELDLNLSDTQAMCRSLKEMIDKKNATRSTRRSGM